MALIEAARSWRDKALLTLLWRSGQRIGDWSQAHGRHGLLGVSLGDLDRRSGSVLVRLKGARDQHRVPVADDFWPLFARYVSEERGLGEPADAAWVALRKGRGRPCPTRRSSRSCARSRGRVGVSVTAHMFRHALAQALVGHGGVEGCPGGARPRAREHDGGQLRARRRAGDGPRAARVNALADLAARRTAPSEADGAGRAPRRGSRSTTTRRPRVSWTPPRRRAGTTAAGVADGAWDLSALRDAPLDVPALAAKLDAFVDALTFGAERKRQMRHATGSLITILDATAGGVVAGALGARGDRAVAALGRRRGSAVAGEELDLGSGGAGAVACDPAWLDDAATRPAVAVAGLAARRAIRSPTCLPTCRRRVAAVQWSVGRRAAATRGAAGRAAGARRRLRVDLRDHRRRPQGGPGRRGQRDRPAGRGALRRRRARVARRSAARSGGCARRVARRPSCWPRRRFPSGSARCTGSTWRPTSSASRTSTPRPGTSTTRWRTCGRSWTTASRRSPGRRDVRRAHVLAFIPHAIARAREVQRRRAGA